MKVGPTVPMNNHSVSFFCLHCLSMILSSNGRFCAKVFEEMPAIASQLQRGPSSLGFDWSECILMVG